MVYFYKLNPFRSHQERSQAPNSPPPRSAVFVEPGSRRESIDDWLFFNHDQSVVPVSRRGSMNSQRRRGSMHSQRRRGSMEPQRRPSMESQRRSSFGEWEVIEDDNNHNVVEHLEDCNAPVQDPSCNCLTCVGFFECREDPEAAKKLHRAWHRQFRGLAAIEEDEGDEAIDDDSDYDDDDGVMITRPARAHLAQSRDGEDQDGEGEETDSDMSTHRRIASKNYPSCDNGGSLLNSRSKSWASSFSHLFGYRY